MTPRQFALFGLLGIVLGAAIGQLMLLLPASGQTAVGVAICAATVVFAVKTLRDLRRLEARHQEMMEEIRQRFGRGSG